MAERLRTNCRFCNAMIAFEKGSTKLLLKHLEDHHNVFEEQELVLSLQFADREVKDILLKKTKKRIENEIGLDNDDSGGEDNEEGGELPRFNYPKFDRKPGSKNWTLTYLRKQVSTFLSVQGYSRNKKRLAEGARSLKINILGLDLRAQVGPVLR